MRRQPRPGELMAVVPGVHALPLARSLALSTLAAIAGVTGRCGIPAVTVVARWWQEYEPPPWPAGLANPADFADTLEACVQALADAREIRVLAQRRSAGRARRDAGPARREDQHWHARMAAAQANARAVEAHEARTAEIWAEALEAVRQEARAVLHGNAEDGSGLHGIVCPHPQPVRRWHGVPTVQAD